MCLKLHVYFIMVNEYRTYWTRKTLKEAWCFTFLEHPVSQKFSASHFYLQISWNLSLIAQSPIVIVQLVDTCTTYQTENIGSICLCVHVPSTITRPAVVHIMGKLKMSQNLGEPSNGSCKILKRYMIFRQICVINCHYIKL